MDRRNFPSIYESELRRNDSKPENRLTSSFFGHVGRLPSDIRRKVLVGIGLIGEKDGKIESIELWPSYSRTLKPTAELDVLLHLTTCKIGVEVKFGSAIKSEQLIREYRHLQRKYRTIAVRLVALTNNFEKPEEVSRAEDELGTKINWISWFKCGQVINEIAEESEFRKNIQYDVHDLRHYFRARGIEMSKGFSTKDDWVRFVGMVNMVDALGASLKTRFEKYKSKHFQKLVAGYPDVPFQGFVGWREDSKYGEIGLWLGIGLFNNENRIQFSVYEEIDRNALEPLTRAGYELSKFGKEIGWVADYKTYSKYMNFSDFKQVSFQGQRGEILEFVDKCLREIEEFI